MSTIIESSVTSCLIGQNIFFKKNVLLKMSEAQLKATDGRRSLPLCFMRIKSLCINNKIPTVFKYKTNLNVIFSFSVISGVNITVDDQRLPYGPNRSYANIL